MKTSEDYTDIPLFGGFDSRGDTITITGALAISNALKYFLCGAKPDLFDLSTEGVIRRFLNRPLTEATAKDLKIAITSAITTKFLPVLIIHNLIVLPDYDEESWNIQLFATTAKDSINITLNETVTARSKGAFNG